MYRLVFWELAALLCLLSAMSISGEDLPHPTPLVSFAMPSEVDAPVDPDANEIAVFDDYSWRAFIALNWPAKPGICGVPDETKKVGDYSDPGTKVVWGTWKTEGELFQAGLEFPNGSSLSSAAPGDETRSADPRQTMVIGSVGNFRDFNQAGNGRFGGPLVAQNHTYVRFQVRLNPVEFDFIRDHFLDGRLKWPVPTPLSFDSPTTALRSKLLGKSSKRRNCRPPRAGFTRWTHWSWIQSATPAK